MSIAFPSSIPDAGERAPTLSLCMIVKNEAASLEQCLRLARPYVDEIVVVDTGSTDGTQAIARRYADVFEEIVWPDSFSTARNYSFDRGTGDFILVLDGDEYIPEAAHWLRIREALGNPDLSGAQLLVRNLVKEDQILAGDRLWQFRLLRNDPRIRYAGRVHNQVQDSLLDYARQTGGELAQLEVEVIHTGYAHTLDKMKDKYRPRLHLLQAEYDQPRSRVYRSYYGYQLGLVHFILEDHVAALRVFGELEYEQMSPDNAFYTHLLGSQAALKVNDPARSLLHCNGMLTISREEPIAYYATGLALLQHKQVADGMLMLLEACRMSVVQGASIRFVLNAPYLYGVLATLCRRAGLQGYADIFATLAQTGEEHPEKAVELLEQLRTAVVLSERPVAA